MSNDDADFVQGQHEVEMPQVYLLQQIAVLQQENQELRRQLHGGARILDAKTFRALTGFSNWEEAVGEYEKAGGDAVFGQLHRENGAFPVAALKAVHRNVELQFPQCGTALQNAFRVLVQRHAYSNHHSHRGAPPKVDHVHTFLLVFYYVFGGVLEQWSPFLPGIGVDQSQFSRLLSVAAPCVVSHWVPLYYCKRSLEWLLANAGPGRRMHADLDNAREADIVLFMDGAPLETEKSGSVTLQKLLYDWSKDKVDLLRTLVITTPSGVIVEMNEPTGGRATEVMVARAMAMLDRLSGEALARGGEVVVVHWIVDRGFFDFVRAVEDSRWDGLIVTCDIPYHLNPPGHRGRRKKDEPKSVKRTQHACDEVDYNRAVAGARWINEQVVGQLKQSRLLHRLVDLTITDSFWDYLRIAAALVNYHAENRM